MNFSKMLFDFVSLCNLLATLYNSYELLDWELNKMSSSWLPGVSQTHKIITR